MTRQPGMYATFETSEGTVVCRLFEKDAPKTVANFVELAEGKREWKHPSTGKKSKDRLYDGTIFHRVIPEFMIQGGDPVGSGMGGPGYTFDDELLPDLLFDRPGRLAMANAGPNTNGSQFFITEGPQPGLDPCFDPGGCRRGFRLIPKGTGYTIFGQCDDKSVELVKKIARMPRGPNDRPLNPVRITHVEIVGSARP